VDRISGQRSVGSVKECSDTLALDRSKSRKDTPALPFCHWVIRAKKPKDIAYPKTLVTLGDQLRARRLDLALFQRDLAAILGVTEDTICYWENNLVKPSPKAKRRVEQFLNF
jgi:DNA-binding XRE family transcriptional regulator